MPVSINRTSWRVIVCAFVTAIIISTGTASATSISVAPADSTVNVGDSFSIDILINDVINLWDYQFDLFFDPTIVRADSVSDGGFLTSGGGTSLFTDLGESNPLSLVFDNVTGMITLVDVLLGPAPPATGATGSGILASIQFTALATGVSPFRLDGLFLDDPDANAIDATVVNGSVTSVPEPGTLLLIASGVIAAASRRRTSTSRHL
jgi:hypothetical protein